MSQSRLFDPSTPRSNRGASSNRSQPSALSTTSISKYKNFVYTDDQSIDDEFKCPICFDPFDDPVCTPCDHTFCRGCIESSLDCNTNRGCPTCRGPVTKSNLKPTNRIISNRIDRYLVKCLTCKQTNIQRGHFEEHVNKQCPKANLSCPAADIRCPWTGSRDQLQGHILACLYEQLRPVLSDFLSTNKNLQEKLNMQAAQLKSIQEKQTTQMTRMKNDFIAQIRELKIEQAAQLRSIRDEIDQQKKTQKELSTTSVQKIGSKYRDFLLSDEYKNTLKTWIRMTNMWSRNNQRCNESNITWTCIYKASCDGFQPQDFHRVCDRRCDTVTIIRSNEGYLFGGYTSVAWNSNGKYLYDSQAFIFTLFSPHQIPPTHYTIKSGEESNAIYGISSCGPCFGCRDIYINAEKKCSFWFPNTYKDTTGIGNRTFTSAQTCSINEIEVYQIN